jgi:hypothetical protein
MTQTMTTEIQFPSQDEERFLQVLGTSFEAKRFKRLSQFLKCSSLYFVADLNDSLLETHPKAAVKQCGLLNQYTFLVRNIASQISKFYRIPINYAIVTGNSYEYVRGRLLEPFDLSNHIIFSEEGLVARALHFGWSYTSKASSKYYAAINRLTQKLYKDPQISGKFWVQPNEVRFTIKPITIPQKFPEWTDIIVPRILEIAKEVGFSDVPSSDVIGSVHLQFDACDIHPNKVAIKHSDGREVKEVHVDKGFALRHLLKSEKNPGGAVLVDSINDLPLIREAIKHKLLAVAVANADDTLIDKIPSGQLYKSKHNTTAAAIGTLSELCLTLLPTKYQQKFIDSLE